MAIELELTAFATRETTRSHPLSVDTSGRSYAGVRRTKVKV
jgi:hypothetical protein